MSLDLDGYSASVYSLLGMASNEVLSGTTDSDKRSDPMIQSENVAKALIETGHDPVIQLILSNDSDYKLFAETVNAYWKSEQYAKAVSLLRQYPKQRACFWIGEFTEGLARSTEDDQVMIDYADYLRMQDENDGHYSIREGDSSHIRVLIKELWRANKREVAKLITDRFIRDDEKPFFAILERLSAGEDVDPEEIMAVFDTYCPLKSKSKTRDEYKEVDRRTTVAKLFLTELEYLDASLSLLKASLIAYEARVATQQMGSTVTEVWHLKARATQSFLDVGDLDGAEEFASKMGKYWDDTMVKRARRDNTIQDGSCEEHAAYVERTVSHIEDSVVQILREAKIGESEVRAKLKWKERVEYYSLRAQQEMEQAIFALKHETPEAAQAHIDNMIEYTEQIGVPNDPDAAKRYLNTLRDRRRRQKRSLRERFDQAGLLDALPHHGGWCNKMGATEEQREADRQKGKALREEREAQRMAQWETSESGPDERLEAIQQAIEVGPEKALAVLDEQIKWWAQDKDWDRGILVLEAYPAKFRKLFAILTKKYFERGYDSRWKGSYSGLMKFYLAGKRLGVVDEQEWDRLFRKLKKARYAFDIGNRQLPHDSAVTMVQGLLEDNSWSEAMRRFKKLQGIGLERATTITCLAQFVHYAAAQAEAGVAGRASSAFRNEGGEFSEEFSRQEQIEYWNTQVECALTPEGKEGYRPAFNELVKLLHEPESVRFLIRFMGIGTARNHHQKKEVLMAAHALHRKRKEVRWRIVDAMIEHDIPGAGAMPEIQSKETPLRVVKHFMGKLVAKGVLDKHTTQYLTKECLPYIRRLLAQHQNQFNTTMEVVHKKKKQLKTQDWANVVMLMDKVGVITPGIYSKAEALDFDPQRLEELAVEIAEMKEGIFSNKPIGSHITGELFAELVWIAYQPANMSLSDVERLGSRVQDCSHHLDGYTVSPNGYKLDLLGNRKMHLRKGAKLATPRNICRHRTTADRDIPLDASGISFTFDPARILTRRLCEVGRLKMDKIDLSDVYAVMEEHAFAQEALHACRIANNDDARYRALRQNQEALGVYLEDNLEVAVLKLLESCQDRTSKMVSGLVKSLKKHGRRIAIRNQLGLEIDDSKPDKEVAAAVITQAILRKFKPLQEARRTMAADVKKFVTDRGEEVGSEDTRLRAVISKNRASFFAKASAGICTAQNIGLFQREDHFHINLIDDNAERCVGNVQAYIIKHEGQDYLLLRGLNPSTKLLKEVDVASLCEAIIEVGKRFAHENKLAGVMLSEQGGFLALSNRSEVTSYIGKAYRENVVNIDAFNITDGRLIRSTYVVAQEPEGRPLETHESNVDPDDVYGTGISMVA